ncbi:IS701 family transposase [Streptomyces iconiensis]|uniref:Transposase n=1 Tax=Streptomyces iconiensis TaxID=1384038 RepID=A0ABT7A3E2_9ACTN|nr:transposase [Streptomyces iconiensis]MDJ1135796.1 transposase [Streptomyces iconiensis]
MTATDARSVYSSRGSETGELISTVFAKLRRRDQLRKAQQYVYGLLEAPGRKSIRNIAALTGDRTAVQSLQHFVSSSPWHWNDPRVALARYAEDLVRPDIWVVRPMVIPKFGSHSVGVTQRRFPHQRRPVNCQEAYGVWLTSETSSVPVHWRLHLPSEWLEAPERRRAVGIPDTARAEPPPHSAACSAIEISGPEWGLSQRPVVLDCGEDTEGVGVAALLAARLPFLARIGGATAVIPRDGTGVRGSVRGPQSAEHLSEGAARQHRVVEWVDPALGLRRRSLAGVVPVVLPAADSGTPRGTLLLRYLFLLSEQEPLQTRPTAFWLTNLGDTSAETLVRLTKVVRRVHRDFSEVTDAVGIRDFEGRTYPGWHRHTTLASVAHAATMVRRRAGAPATPQYQGPAMP